MLKRLGFRIFVGAIYYAATAIVVTTVLFVAGFAYVAMIIFGTAPAAAILGVASLLTLNFVEAFKRKASSQKGVTSLEAAIILIVAAALFVLTVLANRS